MYIDRSPIDRSGIDRGSNTGNHVFTFAISGTAGITELTDRSIPLDISGTGSIVDPAFLRLVDLGISGIESLAWDFCRLYDLSITGIAEISQLVNRTIPLDITSMGQFSGDPIFDWYFAMSLSGTSVLSLPIFDRLS